MKWLTAMILSVVPLLGCGGDRAQTSSTGSHAAGSGGAGGGGGAGGHAGGGGAGGCGVAVDAQLSGNKAFKVLGVDARESMSAALPRYKFTLDDTNLRCNVDELELPDGTYHRVSAAIFLTGVNELPPGTYPIGVTQLPSGGSVDILLSYEEDNVFTLNGQKQTDNGMFSGAGTLTITHVAAGPTLTGSFTLTIGDGSMGQSQGTFVVKPCTACKP